MLNTLDAGTSIESSTLMENAANADALGSETGGGLRNAAGTAAVRNSLLAFNSSADGGRECSGAVLAEGVNLVLRPNGCSGITDPPDMTGDPPLTGGLDDHGGPTPTVALRRGSPAINAADPGCPARDQRGVRRRNCDIGAYERR